MHRTGHSIGQEVHGNGANMDGLETRDDRNVVPRTCFSIEPGIYLPEFGVRSEVNVYMDEQEARVTGAIQTRNPSLAGRLAVTENYANEDRVTASTCQKRYFLAPLVAVAAWLLPGMGHLLLGRWGRALMFFSWWRAWLSPDS